MNFRHPDAQRAITAYRLALVKLNAGHIWLTKQQANERLVAAVIETNRAANPEKVSEMVQALWECES
jgi:ABC-type nitrate/sulfonate/bicarbonate transport system substrate-binding protein